MRKVRLAHKQERQSFSNRCRFMQFSFSIVFAIILFSPVPKVSGSDRLQQDFISPPKSAKPWVYWFWVNGNITKEGITADLEAMQKVGIGGTLIMHVSAGIPAGPVKFFSQEWRELFSFAVTEANRLGLEVTMNACDGWTGTGGPWIKPEEAMMHLTWTETVVDGPSSTPLTPKKPESKLNVYHDIAVLAFPAPPAYTKNNVQKPSVTSNDLDFEVQKLVDGDFSTSAQIDSPGQWWAQYEYAKPFTARGIRFSFGDIGSKAKPSSGTIEFSNDGKSFTKISDINLRQWNDISSITLAFDETTARFFRVVLPIGNTEFSEVVFLTEGRINNWELKSGFARRWGHGADQPLFAMRKSAASQQESINDPSWADRTGEFAVERKLIKDLTKHLDASGRLDWNVPAGKWLILRIGYTPTGETNNPATAGGIGLEPDALNPAGMDAAFSKFVGKLLTDLNPEAKQAMRYCHIDSWETGSQNWTANFAEEFKKRRGYDIITYLPVMTGGHIVNSVDTSERFLWDVRRTIADMLADYYYGRMRDICHQNGIGFQSEAAGASQFLFDPITLQSKADIPMGEFWVTEGRVRPDCKAAASAANIFDKKFVGAEAFTSAAKTARWTQHPYSIKALGDAAFCVGINRYVFHRYAMQPWIDVVPGMTMGPFGIHFERTNTWWDQGSAWMSYIARCQSMLQQGRFVGDVLYFSGEGVPNHIYGDPTEMNPPLPSGYDFDACNTDVLLNMVAVKNGRLVLENGMEYQLLLLSDERTMTPRLIKKIRQLVEAGAVLVGPKPKESPSLADGPSGDREVQTVADALWGKGPAEKVERNVGKGRVFCGLSFEEIFEKIHTPADFEHSLPLKSLAYIHRRDSQADWYFISNQTYAPVESNCAFRVSGKQPELWDPQTGTISKPAVYSHENGRTLLPLRLEPAGSVFVVFREKDSGSSIEVVKQGKSELFNAKTVPQPRLTEKRLVSEHSFATPQQVLYPELKDSFTVAFWVKPAASIEMPAESEKKIQGRTGQQFVLVPDQGAIAYGPGHASAGISVGTNGVCVFEHSSGYFPARLVHRIRIDDWAHIAIVYDENTPSLYINGEKVASASKSTYSVHPSGTQAPSSGYLSVVDDLRVLPRVLTIEEIAALAKQPHQKQLHATPAIQLTKNEPGKFVANIWQNGNYTLIAADGTQTSIKAEDVPDPLPLSGPWDVRFSGMNAPASVMFDKLVSWTEHQNSAIKYFSGSATYVKAFDIPSSLFVKDRRLYLELGDVQVMAEVKINGTELGILWKPPFTVDVTNVLKAGKNNFEIRVTNLWPNRLIGDEQFPPDCKYENGRLAEWPDWLIKGQSRPQPQRLTFTTWKHYDKQSQLLESGLLGPVVIRSVQVINVPLTEGPK